MRLQSSSRRQNMIDRNAGILIAETFKVFYEEACTEVTAGASEWTYRLLDGRIVSLARGQHVTA
jgi:hypothetical protein